MADVRSLLRSEQARRSQLKGSYDTKTALGALPSKKRKALENDNHDRKKSKSIVLESQRNDTQTPENKAADSTAKNVLANNTVTYTAQTQQELEEEEANRGLKPVQKLPDIEIFGAVDEDEWAAFERDVATPPPETNAPSAPSSAAVIQAAPLTAAELAFQAREAQSSQKGRREMELEEEKEDAARQLEEEMEDMEALERRVKSLKERREAISALRQSSTQERDSEVIEDPAESKDPPEQSGQEDDADSEDEWTGWTSSHAV